MILAGILCLGLRFWLLDIIELGFLEMNNIFYYNM